ncbi:TonB-dependent receptor domain-containing protein [Shewanella baltica]|uniref:TonB-dependent receptor domain-containing protein n=1 Tax=Shewanella baltica TaxID=62322 RepID=UPI003D7B9860
MHSVEFGRSRPKKYRANYLSLMGLSFTVILSITAPQPSLAQTVDVDARQINKLQHYQIKAGTLDAVLNSFALAANIDLSISSALTRGKTSLGLEGQYSIEAGLQKILAGTGLQVTSRLEGQYILGKATAAIVLAPITVISAAGYEQDIKNAPASISVLSGKDLEQRKFNSLQDIAREIPGVNVIGSGAQSGISIRGMEKGYTLVLVDGKRVRSDTGNPRGLNNEDLDSNFIPPVASIERVEVVRGPMSSLYGSDAMGGIINIITKKTPEHWSASAGYSLRVPDSSAMGNQNQQDIYISGPLVKDLLGASIWGNQAVQDEDKYYGGYQESTKRTLGGKLRITPNRDHEFILDYSKASQRYIGNPGGVLLTTARGSIDRKWTRDAWSIAYNALFDLGELELKYYEEDYERLTYPAAADFTTGSTNKVGDARFITGVDSHTLTFGGQWTNDKLTNGDLGNGTPRSFGTRSVSDISIFAEDEWELLTEKLYLTLGARLTDNEFFGHHVSPRAYLVFNHNDHWTFKGGIATGYKSPKIDQIDNTTGSQRGGSTSQFVIVGNPDLEPEQSTNYEIGALYTKDDTLNIGATLFFNDFSNKILNTNTFYFDDGNGGYIPAYCISGDVGTKDCPAWATWLNAKGAQIRGVELEGHWNIADTLALKASYTYTDSRIDADNVIINTPAGPRPFGDTLALLDGNSLVGIPNHNGSITLDYQPTDALSAFLRGNYEGEITRVSFERNTVDKSDKDLITLDAGLNYSLNRFISFNVGIDNITDATRFKVNNDTGAYRYSERGRSYFVSVKTQF